MKKNHYYGDTVRKFFMIGAVFMLVSLPFMSQYLSVPLYISILTAIAIGIFAGITNPLQTWAAILDLIISTAAVAIFEYHAVSGYTSYSLTHRTFWVNQVLAVNFLIALYFSTKTVRGMLLK